MEKALETAARQLQLATEAIGALRAEMATAPRTRGRGGDGEAAAPRGGRRGALLDAKTMRGGIFHFLKTSRTPLSTAELMTALVGGAKLQFRTPKEKTNFSTRISIAMRRYEQQGLVKTVGRAGKGRPIKWALAK
jgi:hypothetical protein